MAERDGQRSDALFAPDGTSSGLVGAGADGVGLLPGFELPAVPLPMIGPDGRVTGLAGSEDRESQHPGSAEEPSAESSEASVSAEGAEAVPVRPGSSVEGADPAPPASAPLGPAPPAAVPTMPPEPEPEPEAPTSARETTAAPRPPAADLRAPDRAAPPPARPHPDLLPGARSDRPAGTVPPPVGGVQYRPRVEMEPSILGLSRHARGRFGARAFNLFFIGVFALILLQLIVALLHA